MMKLPKLPQWLDDVLAGLGFFATLYLFYLLLVGGEVLLREVFHG